MVYRIPKVGDVIMVSYHGSDFFSARVIAVGNFIKCKQRHKLRIQDLNDKDRIVSVSDWYMERE